MRKDVPYNPWDWYIFLYVAYIFGKCDGKSSILWMLWVLIHQNCLWIKKPFGQATASPCINPWGFIKGLGSSSLLTKKNPAFVSVLVIFGFVLLLWSLSSVSPPPWTTIQLRWVILTMACWCPCQTVRVNRVFLLVEKKTQQKAHVVLAK